MPEVLDESTALESTTVGIFRTAATVKGGRRFSFGALVVVGNRRGRVGIGYGKANQVPMAIEKAQKDAKKRLGDYSLQDLTIPHQVEGRFGACRVRLVPASPGTGVIAGASVRAVLEMVGIQDCLTKSFGSTNSKNLVKATLVALGAIRTRHEIAALRGVELEPTLVEEAIKRGQAFMPVSTTNDRAQAPVNTVGEDRRGGGRRGGGGGRRGGGGGGGRRGGAPGGAPAGAPAAPAAPSAPPAAEAAPPAPAADPPASGGEASA
jgi:small subunit ribosomal protein S5